ncbi:CaiB/BaiF CoA transferase family protein [Acrocarpospora catenulata]|uniref:CaiB/BaiF CoA transferase family protein n=1 Tax=Acrocarpospora catenulata TaxID=2836182 RepID=UPI001BDA2BE7|nr:CoA transferase [Acrocarpospora catenulata]
MTERIDQGIFAGLKVLDFTWAAAGPIVTKQFSDNGAEVIKIESKTHPDSVRLGGPFFEAKPGINRSGFFADFNSSKKSVAVDMRSDEGRDLVRRLVSWADIVADNFRPGVLTRWGLGHDVLQEINPRAILLSSSLYGEDGPWATLAGFGAQGAAVAGIHGLTGWPDLPPALPKGAYTDSVSPRYAMAAVTAALIHRERTGHGQRIELSQVETTVGILAAQLLQWQLTGREPVRSANREPGRRLHAVLPCAGEDNWIAVDVRTDAEWRGLCDVLARLGGVDLAAKLSAVEAIARAEEVEELVAGVTAGADRFELMDRLQEAGVPAGVVLKGSDLLADPRLRSRGHFWALDHAEMGTLDYNGPAYRFEKTPSRLTSAAPLIGEHTDEVMREVLGLDDDTIARLRADGVLQ